MPDSPQGPKPSPGPSRAARNRNPGNLRYNPANDWLGQTGQDKAGFCVFDTWEHGVRAMARVLLRYCRKHRICSIEGIVTRYAPPSENDTAAYIKNVARAVNKKPAVPLDLEDADTLAALVVAMTHQESGMRLSPQTISDGVALALAK